MQNKKNLIVIIFAITAMSAFQMKAQNSTNSPYTRYGYGRIADHSFGAGRSMGGIGIGLRTSKQINPMNPASYSSMDSMTFLFDFGASAQMSWFSDGTNKQHDMNGNVDYMAMQFPLHKQVAMSIGILPYSSVGYNFMNYNTADGLAYSETFIGTGGINQLYAGLSLDIWKKRLALGANINYVFGSTTHTSTTAYNSSSSTSMIDNKVLKVNDATFDFGLQYTQPIKKNERLIIGLTYSPKNNLSSEYIETIMNSETKSDTLKNTTYELPASYGIGFSYVKDDKMIIALDASYQEWEKIKFNDTEGNFNNRMKISAGFEYIPNLYSRPFFNRVRYRAGLNYTNSYIKVKGNDYKELGATVGFGVPISDNRSYINLSFEYLKIMPESKFMIKEDYARITLSYTFNEWWFFKKKLD